MTSLTEEVEKTAFHDSILERCLVTGGALRMDFQDISFDSEKRVLPCHCRPQRCPGNQAPWRTDGAIDPPALMAADPVTAFLSIENARYGLEHLEGKIPRWFTPFPVLDRTAFEILGVDGLDDYWIYRVEDDATSRLLHARMGELPRECRVPRAVLADVMERIIERLDDWFAQLPEPPVGI